MWEGESLSRDCGAALAGSPAVEGLWHTVVMLNSPIGKCLAPQVPSWSVMTCSETLLPFSVTTGHPNSHSNRGSLSALHPSHLQVGSDAELKELLGLSLVMAAARIFVIDFIVTAIFQGFFLIMRMKRLRLTGESSISRNVFWGSDGGMILEKCEVCKVWSCVSTCGQHCWDPPNIVCGNRKMTFFKSAFRWWKWRTVLTEVWHLLTS